MERTGKDRQRRVQYLLSIARRKPAILFQRRDCVQSDFIRAYLDQCTDLSFDDPQGAVYRAEVAVRLAKKNGESHLICKALGLLGTAHRGSGQAQTALTLLGEAERSAGDCPACRAEILRRSGATHYHLGEKEKGLKLFDRALEAALEAADDRIRARTLISRSAVLYLFDRVEDALSDACEGLTLLSPGEPQVYFLTALLNIAACLARADSKDFADLPNYFATLRGNLKGARGFDRIRVKLRWIEGMAEARNDNRHRAYQLLKQVRKACIRLRLQPELAAVTADLAKLYQETGYYEPIRELAEDTARRLADLPQLRALFDRLHQLAVREDRLLAQAVHKIRAAADVAIPSLV